MAALELPDPSLYQLRHGRASFDRAQNFRTLSEMNKRGRWAADSSVRRYERAARLQSVERELPPKLMVWGKSRARLMGEWIRGSSVLPGGAERTVGS